MTAPLRRVVEEVSTKKSRRAGHAKWVRAFTCAIRFVFVGPADLPLATRSTSLSCAAYNAASAPS